MAYTILFLEYKDFAKRDKVIAYLQERMVKEGKFKATLTPFLIYKGGVSLPAIRVKPVRLVKKKLYCGNHPGLCEINILTGVAPKKINSRLLEWNDWVQFHGLVNRVLNRFK